MHLYDPSMQEHRDSQMPQNSWWKITAFLWFNSVTVLPDGDLRFTTLHVGGFFLMKIARIAF